jgi:hypothetical protein
MECKSSPLPETHTHLCTHACAQCTHVLRFSLQYVMIILLTDTVYCIMLLVSLHLEVSTTQCDKFLARPADLGYVPGRSREIALQQHPD